MNNQVVVNLTGDSLSFFPYSAFTGLLRITDISWAAESVDQSQLILTLPSLEKLSFPYEIIEIVGEKPSIGRTTDGKLIFGKEVVGETFNKVPSRIDQYGEPLIYRKFEEPRLLGENESKADILIVSWQNKIIAKAINHPLANKMVNAYHPVSLIENVSTTDGEVLRFPPEQKILGYLELRS